MHVHFQRDIIVNIMINHIETATQKEQIITPQGVKKRVMEFFEGADLNQIGEIKKGILIISTGFYETDGMQITTNKATVNGIFVAERSHVKNPVRDREIFTLRGGDNGLDQIEVTAIYENLLNEAKIFIDKQSVNNIQRGNADAFSNDQLRAIGDALGIKA